MTNVRRSFTLSPKKRRQSLGFLNEITPVGRRQSLTGNGTPASALLDIAENNDIAERKARQLNRLQQLQSKATPPGSAHSVDRRRSINAVAGFTNQQLADHYTTCIQLSAENKINVKNAFNLQLIDYMTEMLQRKDSDMNNFQVASCTLDASTKIYAYRVDSIHTDTLKMVGGLGRTKDSNEPPLGEEGDVTETLKKRKRKKKGDTIETNLKNLDVVQFDIEYDVDPLYFKMASQFDEGQVGGSSFLNSLPVLDDTCKLLLNSDSILNDALVTEISTSLISIPKISCLDSLISPTFATFEFQNFDLNESIDERKKNLDGSHAFDINAIPEPLEMEINDMDYNDDAVPLCMDDDADENTVVTVGGGACRDGGVSIGPTRMLMTNMKDHITTAPLEYSYFDSKVISAWAGPAHWNFKPLIKDLNRENVKGKGKKKNELFIDYMDDPNLDTYFKVLGRSTKLTQLTIKKWAIENTTLPVDLHYNPMLLSQLYLRASMTLRAQKEGIGVQTLDDSIANYDYDNPNDEQNYCADVSNVGGNYDDCNEVVDNSDRFSQTILPLTAFQDPTGNFFGDNLVSAPNKVAQLNIGYARTAKKMDMKKLKSTMWNILTHPMADKENRSANLQQTYKENMDSLYKCDFMEVYQDLTPRLSNKMAENLSVPLAFVALLHLANEHNLKLNSLTLLGDFQVTQD